MTMPHLERRPADGRSWAPPRTGLPVERHDRWELLKHGIAAGLLAGCGLGVVAIAISTVVGGDPWLPFDFAAAIVVGPGALTAAFPVGASLALGTTIHMILSVLFGVIFVNALALAFQLSARPWLMLTYGVVFALVVWEVNFMAILPLIAPALRGRIDLATQVWNGILSYSLIYGPLLAVYMIRVRPGTLDRWWTGDRDDDDDVAMHEAR